MDIRFFFVTFLSQVRRSFAECSPPAKVLLYSSFFPVFARTRTAFEFRFDGFPDRELLWAGLIGAALAAFFAAGRLGILRQAAVALSVSLAILLLGVLSLAWSPSAFWTEEFLSDWFLWTVYAAMLCVAMGEPAFRLLFLTVAMVLLSALSLLNIIQYFALYSLQGFADMNPMQGAELLTIFLPISAGFVLFDSSRKARVLGWITYALMLLAMLQTAQRSPFLGFLAGFICLAILFFFVRFKFPALNLPFAPRRWLSFTALTVLLVCLQSFPSPLNGFGATSHMLGNRLQAKEFVGASVRNRLQYWAACLQMLQANPISGRGAEAFRGEYRGFRSRYFENGLPFGYLANDEHTSVSRAHNDFLQFCAELGVPGGLLFLGLVAACLLLPLLSFFKTLNERLGAGEDTADSLLGLSAWSGMVVFFVSGCASSFGFRTSVSSWAFAVVFSLAFTLIPTAQRSYSLGRPWIGLLLLISLAGVWPKFKIWMGDVYYWQYGITLGQRPEYLSKSLRWFPNNPGANWIAGERMLEDVVFLSASLRTNLPSGTVSPPNETEAAKTRVHDQIRLVLLSKEKIQPILERFDKAYTNGYHVSLIIAFKALAAEAISDSSLALRILEGGMRDFPDSPFLGAYYLKVASQVGIDPARTDERLRFVRKYQSKSLAEWELYFQATRGEADRMFFQLSSGPYFNHFHRLHRLLREE